MTTYGKYFLTLLLAVNFFWGDMTLKAEVTKAKIDTWD